MYLQEKTIKIFYKLSHILWYLFIFSIPFGTRFIIKPRAVDGVFVEWGTISIFASEIILLFYYFFILLIFIFDWQVVKERLFQHRKVLIVLGIFLLVSFISSMVSLFLCFSVAHWFRLLGVSLLLVSVIILRPKFKTTALIFSLSLIPSFILGIFQFWEQISPASKWIGIASHLPEVLGTSVIGIFSGPDASVGVKRFLRVYGTFPHPNIFAAFLAVNFWLLVFLILRFRPDVIPASSPVIPASSPVIPACLRRQAKAGIQKTTDWITRSSRIMTKGVFLIFKNNSPFGKGGLRGILILLFYILFFLNFYLLFLTFSRAAWLSLVVGFFVFLFFGFLVKRKVEWRKGMVLLCALLIFAAVLGYTHSDLISSRISTDSYLENKSISERMAGYQDAKDIIFNPPFSKGGLRGILFGVGPGAYTLALEQKYPNLSPYSLQPVHNVWLLVLSEIGILGFFAFILFLIQIFAFARERAFIFVFIGAILVLSFFDHYLWSLWPGLCLGGLVLSLRFLK